MNDTSAPTGWKRYLYCSTVSAADRRNQLRYTLWVSFWAVSFVVATRLLRSDAAIATPLTWLIILVPNVLGIVAATSYMHFLRNTDELVRKIQMEGLAIGFAVGVLGAWGYSLLEIVGAPELTSVDFSAIMILSWAVGQVYGTRRYQ